jgi:hypothetical protein
MAELNRVFDGVLVFVPVAPAAGGGSGLFHAPSSGAANSPVLLSIGEIQNAFDVKSLTEQEAGGRF